MLSLQLSSTLVLSIHESPLENEPSHNRFSTQCRKRSHDQLMHEDGTGVGILESSCSCKRLGGFGVGSKAQEFLRGPWCACTGVPVGEEVGSLET